MNSNNLVSMANQIGDFFKAMPDHDEALDGIADHIKKFWDPLMRKALSQHIEQENGQGLQAIVLEALRTRATLWA
jgi:formate dehydrogenase subunit delta